MGHGFSYHAICCHLLSGPKSCVDPPRQIHISGSVPTPKNHLFFIFVKAQQTRKATPEAFKKRYNSTPQFLQNDFCENLSFAILSMRRPWIWNPERRYFDSEIDKKITWKQAQQQKIKFQDSGSQKPSITVPMEILFRTTLCPSCCYHGLPKLPQGAKMAPLRPAAEGVALKIFKFWHVC